jgi:threonine aldolase
VGLVDLRSDTVTRPTPEMRRAMAGAEVGDDAYGEDPTVNELEEAFAARLGKEAALFVPSVTMGNQLALRLLAKPATLVLAGRRSHIVVHENGAAALNATAQLHPLGDEGGHLDPDEITWLAEAARHHHPAPSLLCLENSYMPAAGAALGQEEIAHLAAVAREHGLAVHLDGARLWNAEVATGTPAAQLAASAHTVMCCLSKGLAAPVGSLLAGSADLVAEARAHRQRLGGGMRQAGVLAAAGLVALRTMVGRLAEDHVRAARLAEAVDARFGETRRDAVATNIVTFPVKDAPAFLDHLAGEGVLAGTIAPGVVRLVTHHDVDDAGVERACSAIRRS